MISAHTTDDQVAAFFEAAHTAYRCAEQSASDVSLYDYVIAGFHVRLRFAGAGLPRNSARPWHIWLLPHPPAQT